MSIDIFTDIQRAIEDNRVFVVATVVRVSGSAPASLGQRMLVFSRDQIKGTIGGGTPEKQVIEKALSLLGRTAVETIDFELQDKLEGELPVCGGNFSVLLESFGTAYRLFIFGGGHIAYYLARMANLAGFRVTVIDNREKFATRERFPDAEKVVYSEYSESFSQLRIDRNSYVVILTHGHQYDREVLKKVLETSDPVYTGMIGSQRKVRMILDSLLKEGISQEKIDRVYAPIGINLGGGAPEEIAVSILAQMIACRNGLTIKYSRE